LKILLAVVLALGGLVAAAPAASAAGAGTYHGGCAFDANSQATLTGPDVYEGVLDVHLLTTDSYVPPLPAAATVTCSLRVDGVEQNPSNHLVVTGSGVEAGAQRTTYTARDGQIVQVCTTVHYLDLAGAGDDMNCGELTNSQVPPQQVLDTVNGTFAYLTSRGDPTICPVLGGHAGTYGPVGVDPTGDVSADPFGVLWDCPPYLDGGTQPPPDPAAAVCAYGHVTGTAAYTPALTATVAPHTEAIDVTATGCTASSPGDYTFHLRGTANDACAGAYPATTGSGTLTGTAPGGALTGTYAITKAGVRYWVRGRYTSAGRSHDFDLWLDQTTVCPPDVAHLTTSGIAGSSLTGDGVVTG
jgi:hypothetical protein